MVSVNKPAVSNNVSSAGVVVVVAGVAGVAGVAVVAGVAGVACLLILGITLVRTIFLNVLPAGGLTLVVVLVVVDGNV